MKKPLIHLAIAFVILALVGAGYGYWYLQLQTKSSQLAAVTEQISQDAVETTRVEQAKAELESLATDKATVDQYFISTNDVVPFLEGLQSTGKYLKSTVDVVSVSATPPAAGKPYGQLSLSLTISGSFNAVERTIGAIEYGPYDTKVVSLTLDTDGSQVVSSTATNWNAAVVVTLGTIDSPAPTPVRATNATSTEQVAPISPVSVPELTPTTPAKAQPVPPGKGPSTVI